MILLTALSHCRLDYSTPSTQVTQGGFYLHIVCMVKVRGALVFDLLLWPHRRLPHVAHQVTFRTNLQTSWDPTNQPAMTGPNHKGRETGPDWLVGCVPSTARSFRDGKKNGPEGTKWGCKIAQPGPRRAKQTTRPEGTKGPHTNQSRPISAGPKKRPEGLWKGPEDQLWTQTNEPCH